MKDRFVFLGIKTPARRAALASLILSQKGATAADLLRTARALWALDEREYQYAAVDLLGRHVRRLTPATFLRCLPWSRRNPGGIRWMRWQAL